MTKKIKVILFASSFPPPLVGGSVEYLYNIIITSKKMLQKQIKNINLIKINNKTKT